MKMLSRPGHIIGNTAGFMLSIQMDCKGHTILRLARRQRNKLTIEKMPSVSKIYAKCIKKFIVNRLENIERGDIKKMPSSSKQRKEITRKRMWSKSEKRKGTI